MNPSNLYKSIFFEVAAITSIFLSRGFYTVFIFFVFHSFASFLISQIIISLMPKNYKKRTFYNLILFTVLNSVTLFAGYIASLYMVMVLLKKKKYEEKYEIKNINFLHLSSIFPQTRRIIGEAIANLDPSKISKEVKMNLLKVFDKEISPVSIRIIKRLLTDPDNEIRLYSFQALNKIKNEMSEKINTALSELQKHQEPYEKAKIHKKLALLYFDMFDLEISEESLKNFFIQKSLYHIEEAEKIIGDGELLFIRAKILKTQNDLQNALMYLQRALRYNYDEHIVLPLMAEIYYEMGEYNKIGEVLKRDFSLKIDPQTSPICEIWEG